MKIHFISIGGSIMHNLALALQQNGHFVTGSDDIIYDPAKSRLELKSLLPSKFGWFPENISKEIDLIILGMHAKADNQELLKAQELGLIIHSFPSFVAEFAKNKTKVVVAGSHGKTTTTSMIMHCLKHNNIDHDYLVGAQLEGYENMVRLSDAPIMIIEGDEYLSSAIDRRPKFLHYQPDLCIITGIAWDHINVFKTFSDYKKQFKLLLDSIPAHHKVFVDAFDKELVTLKATSNNRIETYYPFKYEEGGILFNGNKHPVNIFGKHNMSNLNAAYQICTELGLTEAQFFDAMKSFAGAAKRQQLLVDNVTQKVYWDFAHAPSKVKATVNAFVEKFSNQDVFVLVELHTYSSLDKAFLPYYKNSLSGVANAAIFFNPKNLEIKKMAHLDPDFIRESFGLAELEVLINPSEVKIYLEKLSSNHNGIVLIMSSGQLGGVQLKEIFGN